MAQTAINCQDVSARMMELLYGELAGDDRAALEAHVAGCASCRAELAGFQTTRAAARRVLDADEPPARAHQAILRAAAAAVAAKQPQPIEALPVPARPSLWERFRTRWTFPTFATVGAVAVVVLASKVFLEPDKTVELGRQTLRSAPAEAPAPAAEPTAAQPEAQATGKAAAEPEVKRALNKEEQLQPPTADKAPARSSAAPAAHRRHDVAHEPLDSLDGIAKGGGFGGVGRGKGKAANANDSLDSLVGDDDLSEPRRATPPAKPSKREFAPPPPPRVAPAGPPATGSLRTRDREMLEDTVEGNAPPRGNSGPVAPGAGAAPPAAHAGKAKKAAAPAGADLDGAPAASASAPAPVRAIPAAEADEERMTEKDSKKEDEAAAESPVARADRLFAGGQWAAAARAYRDLLRHDPKSADAARWRQRLAASQDAASAQAPAAASPQR